MSTIEDTVVALANLQGPLGDLFEVGRTLGVRLKDADARKELGVEATQIAIQQGAAYLKARVGAAATASQRPEAAASSEDVGEDDPVERSSPRSRSVGYAQTNSYEKIGSGGVNISPLANSAIGVISTVSGVAVVSGPNLLLVGGQTLVTAIAETEQFIAAEHTKQGKITAWRDTTIAQIDATKSIITLYLERTFDERRENFEHLFAALDKAQASGSLDQMQMTLAGILDLVKSSPFKGLEDFKLKLEDPSFTFEL